MEPGRELDTLIAEKVMGATRVSLGENPFIKLKGGRTFETVVTKLDDGTMYDPEIGEPPPPYSTDIAAAWTVVEKLKSKRWKRDSYEDAVTGIQITFKGEKYEIRLMDQHYNAWAMACENTWAMACEESLCLAICVAALEIVGCDISDE